MSQYRGAPKIRSVASKVDGLLRMLSDVVDSKFQPWGKKKFADQADIIPTSAAQRFRKLVLDGLIDEHHRVGNTIFYAVNPVGVEYLRANIELLGDIDLENCDPEGLGRAFLKLTPPSLEAQEQLRLIEAERAAGKSNGALGGGSGGKQDGPADTRTKPDEEQLAVLRLVGISGGYGGFERLCRIGRNSQDIRPDTLMTHLEWLEREDWIKVQYKPAEDDPRTWYWNIKPPSPVRSHSKNDKEESDDSEDES